jgi:hypothetical protein
METQPKHDLVEAMARFASSLAEWRVVAHHTFSWEASLWSARRVYERFMRETLPGVSYFYAIEENPSRDGHHVHAMWDSLEAPRKATHKQWLSRYGRNRIEPIRGYLGVVKYCSKYVVKEGAWWDFRLSRSRRAALGEENFSPLSSLEKFWVEQDLQLGGTITEQRTPPQHPV